MSILEVPGARLCYETRGSGPLMLMVPGASGEAGVFKKVTEHLATHYTVLTYDRRGFSRSQLDGPQDDDRRLQTDADDAWRLIEQLRDEPATVFGASSGGIVALEVLTHHPAVVRTLVPFEPPAVQQLPDGQQWLDFFYGLYDLYRQAGVEPALRKLRERSQRRTGRPWPGRWTPRTASTLVPMPPTGSSTSCASIRRSTSTWTPSRSMPTGSCRWPGANRVATRPMR